MVILSFVIKHDNRPQANYISYRTSSHKYKSFNEAELRGIRLEEIQQRRTFVKEVKSLRLACRHFRHVKRRSKATKALKRLRTIAGILMRELTRKLPASVLAEQADRFALYQRVIDQRRKDKNKVYSLHESDVYCVAKGKDHKPYE